MRRWIVLAAVLAVAGCGNAPGGGDALDIGGGGDAGGGDAGGDAGGDVGGGDVGSGDATADSASDAADDAGADASGDASASDSAATGSHFDPIWQSVFVDHGCSGGYCHGAIWPDADAAYAHLTTASSKIKGCLTQAFVTPGDPAKSLVFLKSDKGSSHGCGKKMPSATGGLPAAESAALKAWIVAGAKR